MVYIFCPNFCLFHFLNISFLLIGWIYKLYMWLLAIFCTNSINIHAGINGLEVGQTVVISCAVSKKSSFTRIKLETSHRIWHVDLQILIHNVMQIGTSTDLEYQQAHTFSIYLVQPLLATSLALLAFNWYSSITEWEGSSMRTTNPCFPLCRRFPSSVFVGDTYTYFAGMTMAVVGILGHFRFVSLHPTPSLLVYLCSLSCFSSL